MSISFAPDVSGAAAAVAGQSRNDWLILGYHGTRDKLHLYHTGEQGVVELKTKLTPEVLFCLVNIEGRMLLVTYLPEDGVSGVQRARALVHSRAVASAFRHEATYSAASPADFTLVALRSKLRLDGMSSVPPSPQHQSPSTFTSPSKFPGPYQLSQATEGDSHFAEKPSSPNFGSQGGVPGMILGNQRALSPSLSSPGSRSGSPDPAQLQQPPRKTSTSSHPQHSEPSTSQPTSPALNGTAQSSTMPARASPRPENEWRQADSERRESTSNSTALAQAMLASSIHDDAPASVRSVENGTRSSEVLAPQADEVRRVSSEQTEREEQVEAQAQAEETQRNQELREREDAARTDRERKEREAAERAREAAEKDARAQWEFERREREKLELVERQRLEQEELARREAAERLRREEQRRAEEKERLEQERVRREEEERTRLAKIEMERLMESQRLEKKLQEEAEVKRRAELKLKERAELQQRFAALKQTGEVMLKGHVSAQGGNSMLWRRRYFELRGPALSLYKSDSDTAKPVDTIALPHQIGRIVDNPEEAAMPHSFKLAMKDDDEWLFYTDGAEDKELLVAALSMAAEL